MNGEGELALEPRELLEPVVVNGAVLERNDLDDDDDALPNPRLTSFLSLVTELEYSLSVEGEPTESSKSSMLLTEADPEAKLSDEELAFMSFPFSFSSKSMNIRERASLYATSRSSNVIRLLLLLLLPVALLRLPMLPDSDGSTSEKSASSPATDPARDVGFVRNRSWTVRRIILKAGWAVFSAGTSSQSRRGGLATRIDAYSFKTPE